MQRNICDNAERFERDRGRPLSSSDCLKTCISSAHCDALSAVITSA